MKRRNDPHRNIPGKSSVFQSEFVAGIEQQQHVGRQVLNASDLLRLAIFKYEDVLNFECWIVMTIRIGCGHGKSDFFREHTHWFLIFSLRRWRGFRFDLRS